MSFSGSNYEIFYILGSVNILQGKDVDSGHYYKKTDRLLLNDNWQKTVKKDKKNLLRFKNSKLTRIYGPVYIDFYDYSTYTDAIYDIFGTQFNANIIFCQWCPL